MRLLSWLTSNKIKQCNAIIERYILKYNLLRIKTLVKRGPATNVPKDAAQKLFLRDRSHHHKWRSFAAKHEDAFWTEGRSCGWSYPGQRAGSLSRRSSPRAGLQSGPDSGGV